MKLFSESTLRPGVFQGLFLVKLLASIGLYLIYTRFYTDRAYADIFRYFDDSDVISRSFASNPADYFRMLTGFGAGDPSLSHYYNDMRNWYNTDLVFNDSRTMIRLCAFLKIFSFGTYFPIAVIFCFLSFCGLTALYRCFDRFLPGRELPLLIGVFLLPSTLLWTSGVIKEAFLLFAAGMLIYQLVLLSEENGMSVQRISALLILLFCLLFIKPYFIFLILPGVISLFVFRNQQHKSGKTIALYLVYFLLAIFVFPPIITGKKLAVLLTDKQAEFIQVAELEKAGSFVHIPLLDQTFSSVIINAPEALLRTLTRPHILEAYNPLMLFSALENLLLNIFILFCIAGISRRHSLNWTSLHWTSLFLVISLSVLIGLTTPVLGAIVRYKVPLLPFLVFLVTSFTASNLVKYKPAILMK